MKFNGKLKYVATYKRINESDSRKRVISDYYETGWISESAKQVELPLALNMGSLYHALLTSFIAIKVDRNENFSSVLNRAERLGKVKREASRIESQMNREKQFNRRVELNRKLKNLKSEIKELSGISHNVVPCER